MLSKIYFSRSSSDSSESSESETETEGSKLEAETDAAGRNKISKKEKLTLKTDQKAKGYPTQKKRYVRYSKTINIIDYIGWLFGGQNRKKNNKPGG